MKIFIPHYLITCDKYDPFFTEWFDFENNFKRSQNMHIYDLHKHLWTMDGETWFNIESDML